MRSGTLNVPGIVGLGKACEICQKEMPEECERLFTPYYTTKTHGTGLGLAIVQPVTSNWIAESVQAEFIGNSVVPGQAPAQLAQPGMQIRTVRAN